MPINPDANFELDESDTYDTALWFTCTWCGSMAERLVEVEDRDEAAGYHSEELLCTACGEKLRRRPCRY